MEEMRGAKDRAATQGDSARKARYGYRI